MIHSSSLLSSLRFNPSLVTNATTSKTPIRSANLIVHSFHSPSSTENQETQSVSSLKQPKNPNVSDSLCIHASCSCRRRGLLIGAMGTSLFPDFRSNASDSLPDPKVMLNRFHPQRPDWYEQFYAFSMENSMKPYEAEIAGYKVELFKILRGKITEVLELGIGTGPNLKYYADDSGVHITGIDPNKSMEKYAREAAIAAGLPVSHFKFAQAVAEGLPVSDASMDAVIGTLVLCSVADVKMTLQEVKRVLKPGGCYIFIEHVAAKDGTTLRFIQSVLDPLQQIISDGCHLTRDTGVYISQAGFSNVTIKPTFVSAASLIGPHVYEQLTRLSLLQRALHPTVQSEAAIKL